MFANEASDVFIYLEKGVFMVFIWMSLPSLTSRCSVFFLRSEQDYPPEANAGNDVVIRLPNNSVILDGSRSKDDKVGSFYNP